MSKKIPATLPVVASRQMCFHPVEMRLSDNQRTTLLPAVVLAAISILLYLPTLWADFVFDARFFVLGNAYLHDLSHITDILTFRVMHLGVMDNNRPVYLAVNMLNWALCGPHPGGYHFVNILLHAAAVLLLYNFALRLGASPWIAFAACLLFAVHPVNSETVSGITYRYDILVSIFILLALRCAAAFQPRHSSRNLLLGTACVVCLFLAVGTKENGVAGPAFLIAYWLLFRRDEPRTGWFLLVAASIATVGAFVYARFTLPPADSLAFVVKPQYPGGSFAAAMAGQPSICAFYFRQILFPMNLCGNYGPWSVRNFGLALSLLVIAAVIALQIWLGLKSRLFALGAIFFWCALLPVSNIFPMYCPIADRFLYLPMAGVALMLASIPLPDARARRIAVACIAIVGCILAGFTLRREKIWSDNLAFWTDCSEKNPSSPGSWFGLGITLYHYGKYPESVDACRRAIEMTNGQWPVPLAAVALPLDALGRRDQARAALQQAAAIDDLFASPKLLVEAFVFEQPDAARLQSIKTDH